jgi:hypothetical protein
LALFKIEKGLANNLSKNRPNTVEGYCYVTTDDGKFYIDTATGTGVSKRIVLNAGAADKLSTARKIELTGDATGSVNFDGSKNVQLNVEIAKFNDIEEAIEQLPDSASDGIKIENNVIKHTNSVSSGTAGEGGSSRTLAFGGTFKVPSVTYDAQGHITNKGSVTLTMPANPNTWKENTASSEGYVAKGSGQVNKVWKTDSSGNPGWRDDDNTTYDVFGPSGANAATGLVPKPSTTAGTTKYLREDGTWVVPPNSNTKNTAGASNTSSKIFLVGATSQASSASTYSHDTVYVDTDGHLYDSGKQVSTVHEHNYLPLTGGTLENTNGDTVLVVKSKSSASYIEFKNTNGVSLGKYGFDALDNPVVYVNDTAKKVYHEGNFEDTGATSVEISGSGNAITSASYDATTRKITLTKGATYNNYSHPAGSAASKSTGLYKIATDGTSHIKSVTAVAKSDITALGIPGQDTTYGVVTSTVDGLVPKFDAADGTIDNATSDWVLTNDNGKIGWYKLPANAFKNDNTVYTHPAGSASNVAEGLYKISTDGTSHVKSTSAVTKADITALGIPGQDTTYDVFTKTSDGLVPNPGSAAGSTKYLREDGQWVKPTNTWQANTASADGYVTKGSG